MKRSTDRILTTHVGSLCRPADVLSDIIAKVKHQPVDEHAFQAKVKGATNDVVRRQTEVGIDIIGDGEQGRASFGGYISERLAGLESKPVQREPQSPA